MRTRAAGYERVARFASYAVCGVCYLSAALLSAASRPLRVPERGFISSQPAQTWEQGLICGNGTIGANALSHPLNETIIFTHERLFMPSGDPVMPPDTGMRLFEIRRLIDRGLYRQATQLAFDFSGQQGFMYPDPFVPAFDLSIEMEGEGEITDYLRSVDFQTGESYARSVISSLDDPRISSARRFEKIICPSSSTTVMPDGLVSIMRLSRSRSSRSSS